ncbi:energy transducer TonB [Hymenobacter sp. GOD-10R]|uniref:energy transducer TonB n=1 Tax=Hymenobacter sp. GOD-10R TaxID=3093922 RepID=UPI002D77D127|nr:energy transducer TonB [Hymenobacter sp. GOD-10R]WRQ28905.1 energy transducer TonB [Hymenobacter sp. GOD-10R]
MLPLPIINVRLQPCDADWQQMTPTAQGRHCAHCDRVVHDFTIASADDLAQARANSPDGRLCGRFRPAQLAPRPQLRPKLQRFLVALVLVCGLGLTSQEAWAQVKNAPPVKGARQNSSEDIGKIYDQVEQMPFYKDGGPDGVLRSIDRNLRYPKGQTSSGRVFINFTVTKTGDVSNVKIMKGLGEPFDAEAMRVIRLLGKWTPGVQSNRPVDVSFTVPVTFSPKELKPNKP